MGKGNGCLAERWRPWKAAFSLVLGGDLKAKSPAKCTDIQKTWHPIEHKKDFLRVRELEQDQALLLWEPGWGRGGLTAHIFHFFVHDTSD